MLGALGGFDVAVYPLAAQIDHHASHVQAGEAGARAGDSMMELYSSRSCGMCLYAWPISWYSEASKKQRGMFMPLMKMACYCCL